LTRRDKRKYSEVQTIGEDGAENDEMDPTMLALEKEHEEITKVGNKTPSESAENGCVTRR
jgi:hypothetical protein